MTADRPKSPIPAGYRTLVPGKGETPAPPAANAPAAAAKPAAPAAKPASAKPSAEGEKPHDDPTRFGDWVVKGRCIDF